MSRLERHSPLETLPAKRSYESEYVQLRYEQFFGVAKLVLRNLTEEREEELMRLIGVESAPALNCVAPGDVSVARTAPNERVLFGEKALVDRALKSAQEALSAETALAVSLDHGCVSFRLNGSLARDVLSSLTPVDYRPDRFNENSCLRTIFAECGILIHRMEGPYEFRLIFDQSYASYAWRMLEDACKNVAASKL